MYPVSIIALTFVTIAVIGFPDHASAVRPPPGVEQYDVLFGSGPRNGKVGDGCRNNNHCQKNLCCLNGGRGRGITCQPRSPPGHPCTDTQVKGGSHVGHCPCLSGDGTCKQGVCPRGNVKRA
ncbi:unnamed protein product [Ixodes hexagonus]